MATLTDYDAPRRSDKDEVGDDSLRALATGLAVAPTELVDDDPDALPELFELPGADLSGEEFAVPIIPKKANEFTCASCFLVYHRSRLAASRGGEMICADCV